MSSIGPTGLILIIFIALIMFGPNKLPELGRSFGRTIREFKFGTLQDGEISDVENEKNKEENKINKE